MNVVSDVITICTAIKYTYGIIKYMFSSSDDKNNRETINENDIIIDNKNNNDNNNVSVEIKVNHDDLMKELQEKFKMRNNNNNDSIYSPPLNLYQKCNKNKKHKKK